MTKLRKAMLAWMAVVALVLLTVGTVCFAQFAEWVSSDVLVRNFTAGGTNRVSSEIMTILGKISNRQCRVIFDGGPWTINSSIGFPTNVSVAVARDCYFNVSTSCIVTFSNNVFEAGPYLVFSGNGTATGSASFLYRWDEWGDRGRFNIGTGVLGQAVSVTQSFNMVSGTTGTFQWVVGGTATLTRAVIVTDVVNNANIGTATVSRLDVSDYSHTLTGDFHQVTGGTVDVYRVTANEINSENGGNFRLDPTTNAAVTFTTSDSYATIQAKIDSYNRFIPWDRYIVVQFSDGTYYWTNSLKFCGFYGGGVIYIRGNQSETQLGHTNQAVEFCTTNYDGMALEIKQNAVGFEVDRIKFTIYNNSSPATNYNAGIYLLKNSDAPVILGCSFFGQVTNFGYGVYASWTKVQLQSNVYSTVKSAQHGRTLSQLYMRGCYATGTCMYGVDLSGASLGAQWGGEPVATGSVANVYTNDGGVWTH